jgi:hypothetical protein
MDSEIDIKATLAKRFFTSSEEEKLAENFKKLRPDEFSSKKTEWKANKEVSEFRMEFKAYV